MNIWRATVQRQVLEKWFRLILILIGANLICCAPVYDATADKMLADTQMQADEGLIRLENLGNEIQRIKGSPTTEDQKTLAEDEAQASYSANIGFYSSLQASVETLDDRITSNPDFSTNSIATALQALKDNVDLVRQNHASSHTISPKVAQHAREILDQQFKALTVYELQIKNGTNPQH
jgi:hypothetical protein